MRYRYRKRPSCRLDTSVVREALHLLTLAGLITPVKHTDGTGVPLGAEENNSYVKYLFFDLGVMQTMLDIPAADILTASDVDFFFRSTKYLLHVNLLLLAVTGGQCSKHRVLGIVHLVNLSYLCTRLICINYKADELWDY